VDGLRARQDDQAEASRGKTAQAAQDRGEASAVPRDLEAPISPAALLSLQGLAGNSAVAQLMTSSVARRSPPEPIRNPPGVTLPRTPTKPAMQVPQPPNRPNPSDNLDQPASVSDSEENAPLGPEIDASPAVGVPPPPPPPELPGDGSSPAPPAYDPLRARVTVESQVGPLKAAALAHAAAIKQKAAGTKEAILGRAATERAAIGGGVARQKAQIAAGFSKKRGELGVQVEGERQAIQGAAEQERQVLEVSTAKRLDAFTTEAQGHRTQLRQKLDEEGGRPRRDAEAQATRAESEVAAGAHEAREIGRREAAKYGPDDTGKAQAAAAIKVAEDTATDIAGKGPVIGRELRGGAPALDRKHAEYAATVDRQITDAVPQVTKAVHAESQAGAAELHTITAASIQQLAGVESHVRAALTHAESAAIQMVDSAGKKQAQQLDQAAQRAASAVERAGREQAAQMEQRTTQVTQHLLGAQMPNPVAVDEVVAAEQSNLASTAAATQVQIDAAHGHVTSGLGEAQAQVLLGLGAIATAADQSADKGLQPALNQVKATVAKRKESVATVVSAVDKHHGTITSGSLDEIKMATSQAVANPVKVNDQLAGDSAKAADQSVAKAKEPLPALQTNVKAAADKAKEERERSLFAQIGMGILKALGGLLIGLVIVIALALVVAFVVGFFGVALTAFGAMMIAGAILLAAGAIYAYYQRSHNPETANMGVGTLLLLSVSDAIGFTSLYEGITSSSIATGKELHLDAEARTEKITTGLISLVMIALAAKGGGSSPYVRPIEMPAAGAKGGVTAAGAVGAELWAGAKLVGKGAFEWVKERLSTEPETTPTATTAGASTARGPRPTKLSDLVETLTKEARARGDSVGADKIEFIKRDPSVGLTDSVKAEFFKRVDAKLQADAKLTPWEAMKQVVRDNPKDFLFKGDDIPPDVIDDHGGMTRITDLKRVYDYMLDPKYLQDLINIHGIKDFPSWVTAMEKDPTIFNPMRDCDPGAPLSGQIGWWVPRAKSGQYSLAELIVDLALQRARYAPGTVRFTLDPVTARTAGFRKPTPLDGMEFLEWGEAPPGSVFGVTEGGVPEAVAPPVALRDATGGTVVVPSGPYTPPALGGASVPSNVKPAPEKQPAAAGTSR
jgi:hypothetical protein